MSAEEAKNSSGVHELISNDELPSLYRRLTRTHSLAYTIGQPSHADSFNFSLNPALHEHHRQLERSFTKVQTANVELTKLRAIKQPEEIAAIESAVKTTAKAFEHVYERISTFKTEAEIEAEFTYLFRRAGADGHAYDPIVATAQNACTLHYINNNDTIRNRQLILIDIGARQNHYAADVTRTYVKGEPTQRQRAVHDAVREAQIKICNVLGPGLSVIEYQRAVDQIMLEAVVGLGLAQQDDSKAVRRYMPHSVSHGLGIDVHDALGSPRTLQPGMVLTVEPGLYLPSEKIGVRIEDDFLITKDGARNLTGKISTRI
jgi:Xaa-Pro aminopeptidase